MGFSDSFKRITKQLSQVPDSGKEFRAGVRGLASSVLTANPNAGAASFLMAKYPRGEDGKFGEFMRIGATGMAPGAALYERRDEFLNDDIDKDNPPSIGKPTGVGSEDLTARQEARRRAIAESVARRRRSGTLATSPLGVQGDGASLGKKRLLGE